MKGPQPKNRLHVNTGTLFGRARALDESPVFAHDITTPKAQPQVAETLHIALVKIRNAQDLDEKHLDGIAQTLSQLATLAMTPCIILESGEHTDNKQLLRGQLAQVADRLVSALERIHDQGARKLDNIFNIAQGSSSVRLHPKNLLLHPLRRGQIPVILPTAFSETSSSSQVIKANEAMQALTRAFAGLENLGEEGHGSQQTVGDNDAQYSRAALDRIIFIDPAGGPPHLKFSRPHVFINLQQEYGSLRAQYASEQDPQNVWHASNLESIHSLLQLLPSTSSAIITTPEGAANLSAAEEESPSVSAVGTRRQKNALIHNLLTDKPVHSSSLPTRRISRPVTNGTDPSMPPVTATTTTTATLLKRGMPVTILPDPTIHPWHPNSPHRLTLNSPQLDLPRLASLIEDSFSRPLNLPHFLNRINPILAGLIIAGEYEGCALFTWEDPIQHFACHSAPHTSPFPSPQASSNRVPYLDKFAVRHRSQGAGGVADILFNAMIRDCFPKGVCWRSRKDNPVNKWYFERSRGTWKVPDMNWTMFWTTEGVALPGTDGAKGRVEGGERSRTLFEEYEAVCRGVVPSWADVAKAAD